MKYPKSEETVVTDLSAVSSTYSPPPPYKATSRRMGSAGTRSGGRASTSGTKRSAE